MSFLDFLSSHLVFQMNLVRNLGIKKCTLDSHQLFKYRAKPLDARDQLEGHPTQVSARTFLWRCFLRFLQQWFPTRRYGFAPVIALEMLSCTSAEVPNR